MADEQGRPTKDAWDKLAILSGFLASVLVPVALAVVGNWYTNAIKDRETTISERDQKIRQDTFDREWVQLGLEILRAPDTTENVRKWGVQIVSHYASVKMEDEAKAELAGGAILPEASVVPAAVQQTLPQAQVPLPSTTSRASMMDRLQTRGIDALLKHDLDGAIAAYDEAYQLWPTFRNADEIRKILIKAQKEAAANPQGPDWQAMFKAIVKMDLRGVAQEQRDQLLAAAGS